MSATDEILKDAPFRSLMVMSTVESLAGPGVYSGQTFMVTATDGRRFKLRRCGDVEKAKRIEENVRRFSHIFPKLYGREGRYILMEALSGYRDCTVEDLHRNARMIGRICAEIHQADVMTNYDRGEFFTHQLIDLHKRGVIDDNVYLQTIAVYDRLVQDIDVKIRLDMNDIHAKNFMIDEKGNMLFVDEDGIAYRAQGMGMAKLLKQLPDDATWREFEAGYGEVETQHPFTSQYKLLLFIMETVRSIHYRVASGNLPETVPKEIAYLCNLVT